MDFTCECLVFMRDFLAQDGAYVGSVAPCRGEGWVSGSVSR